jgi:hypothetical protein
MAPAILVGDEKLMSSFELAQILPSKICHEQKQATLQSDQKSSHMIRQ